MNKLSLPIYNLSGTKTTNIDLDTSVFGVTPNPVLIHQALTHYLTNARAPFAHTKDRSAVAGSGKKPWKQKGTGNARAGSVRSPLWRGGGITFGPNNERSFNLRLPQKMRQAAFRMALSSKVVDDNLILITSLDELQGKTKQWLELSKNLPKADTKLLIVDTEKEDVADRAIRNIPTQKYTTIEGLTIYDLLQYPVVLLTQDALTKLTERLHNETVAIVATKSTHTRASQDAEPVTATN